MGAVGVGGGLAGASGGGAAGFAIGTAVFPGVGSAIGAIAGAIGGGIAGNKISTKVYEGIEEKVSKIRLEKEMNKGIVNLGLVAERVMKMKASCVGKENEQLMVAKLILNVDDDTPIQQVDERYLHLNRVLDR